MSHLKPATLVITIFALTTTAQGQPDEANQVLLIPLAGTIDGPLSETPERLTLAIAEAIRAIDRQPIAAAVGKSDITAITGCPAESDECFREVASTIDVDHIVFGSVASSDAGVTVSLTIITRGGEVTRREIDVEGSTTDQAATDFAPKARAFLLGQPAPESPTGAPDGAPPPPPADASASVPPAPRFALNRVEKYSWGVTGGGLAVIGVGAILLIMADGKQSEVNDAPVDTVADLDHLADLENTGKSLTTWGNGMMIVGAIATIAGAALIVKQGLTRSGPEQPPTTISLLPAGRGAGFAVTLLGSF